MVRVLFFLFPLFAYGATVQVQIDDAGVGPNSPIQGTVSIAREDSEQVDATSFLVGEKALPVQLVGESRRSAVSIVNGRQSISNEIISTYQFQIDSKEKGVHTLPPISVEIDGSRIASAATTFQIESGQKSEALELGFLGAIPKKLYVGQRVILGYWVHFRDKIDLTQQELPLLKMEGLDPIGRSDNRSYSKGKSWVEEAWQQFEAKTPGRYEAPLSSVQGRSYRQDWFGRRVYDKTLLRSELTPVTLNVEPLPDKAPKGFQGTLGEFQVESRLIGSDTVLAGDKLRVEVVVHGDGEWHTLHAPQLKADRQFTKNFRLSDLPPEVVKGENRVVYRYELRPLSDEVKEVPSVALVTFSTQSEEYRVARSKPIPISVSGTAVAREPKAEVPRPQVEMAGLPEVTIHPPMEISTAGHGVTQNSVWMALAIGVLVCGGRSLYDRFSERLVPDSKSAKEHLQALFATDQGVAVIEKELMGLVDQSTPPPGADALLRRIAQSRYSRGADLVKSDLLEEMRRVVDAME